MGDTRDGERGDIVAVELKYDSPQPDVPITSFIFAICNSLPFVK